MLFYRSTITLQRGSASAPITYDDPFDAPIINLAPYENLTVDYSIYYQIFLIPRVGKEDDAKGRVLYYKPTPPAILAIDLAQNDWQNEDFYEGDEVLIFSVPSLVISGSTLFSAFYAKINSIKGSKAVFSVYASNNANLAYQMNYFFVFCVEPERRGQAGVLPATFQTIFKRFGDVDGDVSPLSGLRYAEPHANSFFIELDSHTILGYDPGSVPQTGIYDTSNGRDILFYPILFFLGWTAVPPNKRSVSSPRVARRRIRIANFFSYRQEYNTLARSAQRDLYHENADLITKLVLNSDEREIRIPLRLRLMHANVLVSGSLASNVIPSIAQGGGIFASILNANLINDNILGAAFALTTDNNAQHLSTRIRHQHDLTRYTPAFVQTLPNNNRIATLNTAALLNDLRRNPFETYVVAIWHLQRPNGEEYVLCSDALPIDIDENIDKIITWQNENSLNVHYHRFNNIILEWSEAAAPEKGEYQVYIRVRKDLQSPAYTVQNYTFKVDESTREIQTSTTEAFYCLHFPHQDFIYAPPNAFITERRDFVINLLSSNQYAVTMRVPSPGFDNPQLKTPNLRPERGTFFEYFKALGNPVFTILSGSQFHAAPIRVCDGYARVYVITPSGKIYATGWRQIRAQDVSDSNSVHFAFFAETTNFVIAGFPNIGNPPNIIKANVKLFNESISTLKPLAEAAYDPFSNVKTSDLAIIVPIFGFFNSRFFLIFKSNLPPGRYKVHLIASYSDTTSNVANDVGFQGYVDDFDYEFQVSVPPISDAPIEKQECCYNPPIIKNENIKYLKFDEATNTYTQQNITIPSSPSGAAYEDFQNAYECCFKIYDKSDILKDNFVDIIAVFDNRVNNLRIEGEHWFRYRGFLQAGGYEISEESYIKSDLSEEPVLKTFRKKYTLELFLTDCDIKQLDFQKLARRWKIKNYTNSLLSQQIEVLLRNIEYNTQYNKLKATIELIDYKPDEYRHK